MKNKLITLFKKTFEIIKNRPAKIVYVNMSSYVVISFTGTSQHAGEFEIHLEKYVSIVDKSEEYRIQLGTYNYLISKQEYEELFNMVLPIAKKEKDTQDKIVLEKYNYILENQDII